MNHLQGAAIALAMAGCTVGADLGALTAEPAGPPGAPATKTGAGADGAGADPAPGAPSLQLANLPSNPTTATSASITYSLQPAVPTYPVYCRLDSYAPIVCPNPFVLGQSEPLSAGHHHVDYYIDRGSGITAASTPSVSYEWAIGAAGDAGSGAGDAGSGAGDASLTPMMYVTAAETLAQNAGHAEGKWFVQALGSSHDITVMSEASGLTGSDLITGPSTVGASSMRFGRIVSPTDATKHAFYFASDPADPSTYAHRNRVELTPRDGGPGLSKTGNYWVAVRKYMPVARKAAGGGVMLQVHNSYSPSTVFGPWCIRSDSGGIWPNNPDVSVNVAWSSQDDPSIPWNGTTSGYNQSSWYPYISDSASMGGQSYTKYGPSSYGVYGSPGINQPGLPTISGPADSNPYPTDTWVDWVVNYRGDPTGGTGFINVWLNGVQVVQLSGVNIGTPAHPGALVDYVKSGLDASGGLAYGTWELLSSLYVFADTGKETAALVRAKLY